MRMRMLMFFEIQRVFYGFWNPCGPRLLQLGTVGAVIFIIIAASPNIAVAQFPGVGSEAPRGEATTASGDVTAGDDATTTYEETSVSDEGISNIGGNASNDGSDFSNQINDDGGSFDYRAFDSGISTSNLKKEHHRKQLFIKRLRLEFAAIEFVERKTGLPFSRFEVPRYLNELRSDLKKVVAVAENGEIVEGALKSIARDAYFIEKHLNDHLDHLLETARHPVPKKPFFTITTDLPKPNLISGAEINALALKYELAEYGEKALQAMGMRSY